MKTLVMIAVLLWACAGAVAGDRPPNIVLLLADDLGYGELGCQGNPQIPTPHIDAIAAEGIRFTSGYVTASYCSPSRAGLLTGRYQTRFGHELNPIGRHNFDPEAGLPRSEVTLAVALKSAGYRTALVGKWHLGAAENYQPQDRGFDEFYGFLHEGHFFVPPPYEGVTSFLRSKPQIGAAGPRWREGNIIYSSHMGNDEPPYDRENPILRGRQEVSEPEYLTDALTREAVDFIQRNHDSPFFLYLSYNAVHSPLQGADAYMERFSHIEDIHRRVFAAMLANLDDSVGAVMEKLRATGIEDNTLVFFLSDNGGPTKELTSSNLPLRGGKGDMYEGGLRIPFLVQWKGKLPAGQTFEKPVVATDIYATALSAAGAVPSFERHLDGVDLLPYLLSDNDGQPHERLYWRMQGRAALRLGDWKLVRNPGRRTDSAQWELYDLSRDVGETNDLASRHPEKLEKLTEVWRQLDAEMVPPAWTPRK